MTIGEIIRDYREENEVSVRKFAVRCGLSSTYISQIENGSRKSVSIDTMRKLASGMGISLKQFTNSLDDVYMDEDNGLSMFENRMLAALRSLNGEGQRKIIEYADDIVASGRYKKDDAAGMEPVAGQIA